MARGAAAGLIALLGLFHVQFAIPNFVFSADCTGNGPGRFASCTTIYEGLLSLLAGIALLSSALLLVRARPGAAAVALVGTVPLTLFFWLVAVPKGDSDTIFGYLSLPTPVVAATWLAGSLLVRRARTRGGPPGGVATA